jgi:hypothetical protein
MEQSEHQNDAHDEPEQQSHHSNRHRLPKMRSGGTRKRPPQEARVRVQTVVARDGSLIAALQMTPRKLIRFALLDLSGQPVAQLKLELGEQPGEHLLTITADERRHMGGGGHIWDEVTLPIREGSCEQIAGQSG